MGNRFSAKFVTAVALIGIAFGIGLSAFTGGAWGRGESVAAQALPPISTPTPERRTITVTGTGIATLPPDLARFSVGITEQGTDVLAPQAAVATKTDAIIAALRTNGVDIDRDVRTSNYSIQPIYDTNSRTNTQTITGYRVTNQVNVAVRDIRSNRVGTLIDATVKAGANTVSSISFGLANPDAATNQAREDAVRNARAKADTLTRVAGASVGPVMTISETSVSPVEARMLTQAAPAASGGAAPPTSIQAGETSVTINVIIVYSLQ